LFAQVTAMTEPSWRIILELQQEYFIKRLDSFLTDKFYLSYNPTELSCLNSNLETEGNFKHLTEYGYTELVKIDLDFGESMNLEHFCEEMVDKYDGTRTIWVNGIRYRNKEAYASHMFGKLGEEAVKRCLGDLITDVDYKIYPHGDGGIDFRLVPKNEIGIQVKTIPVYRFPEGYEITGHDYMSQSGRVRDLVWKIPTETINKNKVLICVLMLNCVQGDLLKSKRYDGETYDFVIAGFKPTKDINKEDNLLINNFYNLKIKDLLYGGGIPGYLKSLT
jgi:hypothetical protein